MNMKNTFTYFLILIALAACNSKNKPATPDSAAAVKPPDPLQQLREKFRPFITGSWVKRSYIDSLAKTRSPYNSKGELGGVAALFAHVPDSGDSTHVGYSMNNHEGADFILYLKPGQKPNTLKTNLTDDAAKGDFYELGYSVKNGDTALVMYHYTKNKRLTDSAQYTKVTALNKDDAASGIEHITNQTLISGLYTATDAGKVMQIRFFDDGKITGLSNFKTYYVNTDFVAGPENNLDELDFDVQTKQQKSFTYKFNKDTLNIFETKLSTDSVNLVVDKLKYKLVKQQ
jgi:hypothetical protein